MIKIKQEKARTESHLASLKGAYPLNAGAIIDTKNKLRILASDLKDYGELQAELFPEAVKA